MYNVKGTIYNDFWWLFIKQHEVQTTIVHSGCAKSRKVSINE